MKKEYLSFQEALSRLCDVEAHLSHLDLYALSGPSREETALFDKSWASIPVERRRSVIRMLVESAEANFEMDFNSLFRCCLADQDDQVRLQAVEGLWECEETSLVDVLVRMMRQDPCAEVRAAAALSLSRFALRAELGDLDARRTNLLQEALLATINDVNETVEVRRRAVEAIAYFSIEGVREIIEAAYNGEAKMRASAVFAMGRSGDLYWADTVLTELSAEEPEMRYEAARASGELQLRQAVPLLARLVNDPDREIQEAALWALGQIGGPTARRILERSLQSDDEVLRAAAEDALGELNLGSSPLTILEYELRDEGDNSEDETEDEWLDLETDEYEEDEEDIEDEGDEEEDEGDWN